MMTMCRSDESFVRRVVAKMFGIETDTKTIGTCRAHGNATKKMLGEMVAAVGEQYQIVVVDLTGVNKISGRKPWWK